MPAFIPLGTILSLERSKRFFLKSLVKEALIYIYLSKRQAFEFKFGLYIWSHIHTFRSSVISISISTLGIGVKDVGDVFTWSSDFSVAEISTVKLSPSIIEALPIELVSKWIKNFKEWYIVHLLLFVNAIILMIRKEIISLPLSESKSTALSS